MRTEAGRERLNEVERDHSCRVLLLLWGTNKFLKKLIKPWAINNNELVDFISRVPDNEELVRFTYE